MINKHHAPNKIKSLVSTKTSVTSIFKDALSILLCLSFFINPTLGYAADGPINSGGGDPEATEFIAIGRRINRWLVKSQFKDLINPESFKKEIEEIASSMDTSFPLLVFSSQVTCDLNDNSVEKAGCVLAPGIIEINRTIWNEDYSTFPEKKCELVTLEILKKMGMNKGRYDLAHLFIERDAQNIICDIKQPTYPLPQERLVKNSVIDARYACFEQNSSDNYEIVAELALDQNPDYLRIYRNNNPPDIYVRTVDRRPLTIDPSTEIPKLFLKDVANSALVLTGFAVGVFAALPASVILGSEAFASILMLPSGIAGQYAARKAGHKILYKSSQGPRNSKDFLDQESCKLLNPQNLRALGFIKQ